MKSMIPKLMICFGLLLLGNSSFAQDLGKSIDCETSSRFNIKLEKTICINALKASTLELAKKRLAQLLDLTCNPCPVKPDEQACKVTIDSFIVGGLTMNEDSTRWCTGKLINLFFSCDECIDTIDSSPFIEEGINQISDQVLLDNSEEEAFRLEEIISEVSYWRIFPNPTSGQTELEINTSEAVREVKLIARNIAGQIVYEKDYGASAKGTFKARADLSVLSNGWYMLSVYLDDELLGTEKIAISK